MGILLFLSTLIFIFFYAVYRYWQIESIDYMKIIENDFDKKYQEFIIKKNFKN